VEFENAPKPKQLDLPQLSDEDRAEIEKSFAQLREKLSLPAPASTVKRRSELKRQAREIVEKYGRRADG
jgi:hypothetical protein